MPTTRPRNEAFGAIWHAADGRSWRAKFNAIQMKAGVAPTFPELMPETAEEYKAMAEPAPEAKTAAVPANITELQASIAGLKKERDDWQSKFDRMSLMFDQLERSLGVSACRNVANVPRGESRDLLTQFNEMPDSPEKTKFYSEHKAELSQFINLPKPS